MRTTFLEKVKREGRKKENVIIEFSGVLFGTLILVLACILCCLGLFNMHDLLTVVFGLLLGFLPIYFYLIKKRDQTILISFTSKYLLEKDESKLDELLGILIAGTWEKLNIDPIKEFFKCIKEICSKNDYEMKRRIAEALPALFKIDIEESKEIVEILRQDWDEKFRSDNRRRTIEALPYIIDKDKKFVEDKLSVIDGDEIFTVISIVEVLDVFREKINKNEAKNLFIKLKEELEEREYGLDEITAIDQLWYILGLIHSNHAMGIKKFEEFKDSSNVYIQICVARNLKHLYKKFPKRTLELIDYFIEKDKHKQVRRPIAKEDSLEFLISLLHDKRYSKKAKEVIWELITDEDDIIRLATFDKIGKILDTDNSFGERIIQYVIERDSNPKLVERAKNLKIIEKR